MNKERKLVEVEDKKVYLRMPTVEENRLADVEYSKSYNQYLKEGLPLAEELETLLRQRGIFSAEQDQKFEQLKISLQECIMQLQIDKDEGKRKDLAEQLKSIKLELFQFNLRRNKHLVHTVENKCDELRVTFLVSRIVEHEDGKPYWGNLTALQQEQDHALISAAVYQFLAMASNVSETFFDEVPELLVDKDEGKEEVVDSVDTASVPKEEMPSSKEVVSPSA